MTKFSEVDFRAFDKRFVIVRQPLASLVVDDLSAVPWDEQSDATVMYGYVSHLKGIAFDVVAPAYLENGEVDDEFDPLDTLGTELTIGIDALMEQHCDPIDGEGLPQLFATHIEKVEREETPSGELAFARSLRSIDNLRSPEYPDDVQVLAMKEDLPPELVWVRLEGARDDGEIWGTLHSKPFGDYGFEEGDEVFLAVVKEGDDVVLALAAE